MPDAFQNGTIGSLHDLVDRPIEELEGQLTTWNATTPIALVIPSLFSELEGTALPAILDEVAAAPYLSEVIIGLDQADADQFRAARKFFDRLPQPHRVIWQDGPRLQAIHRELDDVGLAPAEPGKGRNVWYCLGYLLATDRARTVALHDADILTYDRRMLARLIYPVAHPDFGYEFAKAYYFRADDDRLNGRVSRLLVTPLLRALQKTVGPVDYLDFLESFRYPLAGEFSMTADVMPTIRIPSDWGIEISVLSEIHRCYPSERVCQVDIGGPYDHKHQTLSAEDPEAGLARMATDVAQAILGKLFTDGVVLSPAVMSTIEASYRRSARRLVGHYENDARFNGYSFDRAAEEEAVSVFAAALERATHTVLDEWDRTHFIPNWARVVSSHPETLGRLAAAIDADNE
ncbi:MAG: glycosyl transferase [Acidimicrobiales bacterium]